MTSLFVTAISVAASAMGSSAMAVCCCIRL
jgi:hypothetical protein